MKKQINIIVGLPGSGKTTLLNYLKLQEFVAFKYFELIDLDEYIAKYLKLSDLNLSLGEWIEQNGFEKFRDIEANCLRFLTDRSERIVLALGGGTLNLSNLEYLNSVNANIIELTISPEESILRIRDDSNRPLSKKPHQELIEILEERKKIMQQAVFRIAGELKVEDQAQELLEILQK